MTLLAWMTPTLIAATLLSASPSEQAELLAPDVQVRMFMKVILYDRAPRRHAAPELTIGVLYDADDTSSLYQRTKLLEAFRVFEVAGVRGRKVVIKPIPFERSSLHASLARAHVDAVYVSPGLAGALDPIRRASRDLTILSYGPVEAYSDQLATVVTGSGSAAKIVINQAIAVEQGCELDPDLLDMAQVIRPASGG